ncbi:oleosin 18.2 kDa [Tanacetum coccineum]
MALLPLGVILLGLAGITLVGTMMGLALATPVFILFSPVIVPAVMTIGLSVMGFLTCGTFGLTGLSSLGFVVRSVRMVIGSVPEQVEHVKKGVEDVGVYTGQKTVEVGKMIMDMAGDIGQQSQTQSDQGQTHSQNEGLTQSQSKSHEGQTQNESEGHIEIQGEEQIESDDQDKSQSEEQKESQTEGQSQSEGPKESKGHGGKRGKSSKKGGGKS